MTCRSMLRPSHRLLLALAVLLLPLSVPAQGGGTAACFNDAAIDPVAPVLLQILAQTDELVAVELGDGASAQSVYLLTRQMVFIERILRRMLGRGAECAAIADGIAREYALLKRGYEAFAQGDPELAVEAVASRRSQALLQDIRAGLAQADPAILALLR